MLVNSGHFFLQVRQQLGIWPARRTLQLWKRHGALAQGFGRIRGSNEGQQDCYQIGAQVPDAKCVVIARSPVYTTALSNLHMLPARCQDRCVQERAQMRVLANCLARVLLDPCHRTQKYSSHG